MAKIIRDSDDIIRELQPNNVDLKLKLSNDVKTDLNNKVGKTDYAGEGISGAIKAGSYYATEVNTGGSLRCQTKSYSDYSDASNYMFISKGTLNNVLTATVGDINSVLDAINGESI